MKVFSAFIALGLLVSPSGSASAAESEEVVYKKHTVVTFGDDTIDGDLSRPDTVFIESENRRAAKNLIKLRADFRRSILRSVR
ncbi:MAG: hypothetical protein AAFU77_06940 [Myxococcota bacterium]